MKYSVFEQIVDGVVHGNGTIGIAGRSNIYVAGDGFILKIVEAPAKWLSLIQRWLDDPDIFVGRESIDDIVQKYNKIFIKYIECMTVEEWASRVGYKGFSRAIEELVGSDIECASDKDGLVIIPVIEH